MASVVDSCSLRRNDARVPAETARSLDRGPWGDAVLIGTAGGGSI